MSYDHSHMREIMSLYLSALNMRSNWFFRVFSNSQACS